MDVGFARCNGSIRCVQTQGFSSARICSLVDAVVILAASLLVCVRILLEVYA